LSTALTIEPGLERVASEWEELAERSAAKPFQRPAWFSAWWGAFGDGVLQVAVLRRNGAVVGTMPLLRDRYQLRSPTNWHTPAFGPLATSQEDEEELLMRVFSLEIAIVSLAMLDFSHGNDQRVTEAARRAGRRVVSRPLATSPSVVLDGDWEGYERGLSKNRRKGIRRRLRGLEAQGEVLFEVDRGEERLDELLEEAFRVEASGWKGERGTAIASGPETRSFYTGVARWAAERGWLRLGFLRLDGRPLAVDFAIEQGGAWYSLKAGYESAYSTYAPGVLLLHAELRHAFASGLERFELLGQADDFKRGWTDRTVEFGWVGAFASSPAGRVLGTVTRARERIRPVVQALRSRAAR
jgi:CelD/BcsL family acetyltransferase involved in cellulose biosynthesis